MNKKLLALAVAGAMAAPLAANADVTIYGKLHMSVDVTDNGSNSPLSPSNHTSVSSNSSRIGFKGSEDLGNGLSAVWQIEQTVALDESGSSFASRQSFLGMGGSFGTVVMGYLDTPYKGIGRKFDVFGDTIGDSRDVMGNVDVVGNSKVNLGSATGPSSALPGFDLRVKNAIAYISPNMNGLQVVAAYTTDSINVGGSNEDNNDWDAVSASATYKNGGLMLAAAYERHNFGPVYVASVLQPNLKTDDGIRLGASYAMNATKMGIMYEVQSGNAYIDRDGWTAFLTQGFGNNTAKVQYSTVSASSTSGAKDGSSMFSVGLDHSLSKRTGVYVMYSALQNDQSAKRVLGHGGHGDKLTLATPGNDQTGFSLGMTHKF